LKLSNLVSGTEVAQLHARTSTGDCRAGHGNPTPKAAASDYRRAGHGNPTPKAAASDSG